jgi:glycosyltransferase involved in cell wall biosynthesis
LRILFLIDGLARGGKERQLVELATGLARTGRCAPDDVAVLSMGPPESYDRVLQSAGIRVHRLVRQWRWDPRVISRMGELFREYHPDIIHSFSLMSTIFAGLAARPAGSRLIDGSIRNAFPRNLKEQILHRIAFRFADRVVANSRAGLRAKGAPERKSAVLYNGFDLRRAKGLKTEEETRAALHLGSGPVVGMVGGFSEFKDWDTFFEAARIVRERKSHVNFVAVGGGATLEKYRSRYGNDPGVVFAGPRDEVEEILNIFDVGVLSSFGEGLPNAVLEYMALGRPAVVTDGGGTRELVVDGETGFVVPQRSPKAVAERVLGFLEDPALGKRMGEAGRERVLCHFSMEAALDNLCGIYSSAMEEGNGLGELPGRTER